MYLRIVAPGGVTFLEDTTIVDNINAIGKSEVKFKKLFVPLEPGQYSFILSYQLPTSTIPTIVPKSITILPGLGNPNTTTIYQIGTGTFLTLRSAIEALYHRGVHGHIVFEFNSKSIAG